MSDCFMEMEHITHLLDSYCHQPHWSAQDRGVSQGIELSVFSNRNGSGKTAMVGYLLLNIPSFQLFTHINNIVLNILMLTYLAAFCIISLDETPRHEINGSVTLDMFGAHVDSSQPFIILLPFLARLVRICLDILCYLCLHRFLGKYAGNRCAHTLAVAPFLNL